MTDRLLESYEAVPYDSRPIHVSHVSSIELIARLHHLTPPSTDRCRVLELGCASGGNLVPMAVGLPDSRFVGIDLAPTQVAMGQETVGALGLRNITLHAMSIADVTSEFGEFDYILCHGVYSWVPAEVQDHILRVCSENLSSNGIAYVSYNTYPGWRMRAMARDMMVYHDDPSLPPAQRVARARSLMEGIAGAAATTPSPYATVLGHELEVLRGQDDALLLHEQLEPFNSPVYFTEFANRAAAKGLRYVSEAKLGSSATNLPDWLAKATEGRHADIVRVQQYIDFVRGRTFRQTLLCHEALAPALVPSAERIRPFHLVMRGVQVEPSAEDARRSEGTAQAFRSPDDVTVTTNNPMVVTALRTLARAAPAALSFADLSRRVDERLLVDSPPGLAVGGESRTAGLENAMLQCVIGGLVELVRSEPSMATTVTERPVATALARHKAGAGGTVPNLRHYPVEVSGIERLILMHLDGAHRREQLLDVTVQAIADGRLTTGAERPDRAQLAAAIDEALRRFAAGALLEA